MSDNEEDKETVSSDGEFGQNLQKLFKKSAFFTFQKKKRKRRKKR